MIIGVYLPPSTLKQLPEFEEALTSFWYQDPIVLGYLSTKPNSQQVADLLMELGMMDFLHHFWKRWRFRHVKTGPWAPTRLLVAEGWYTVWCAH